MCPERESGTDHGGITAEELVGTSDYYDLLGVETTAETAVINDRYRDLAQKVHPDQSDDPEARRLFRQVQEAKKVLSDDDRRWLYDHLGHDGYYQLTTGHDSDLSTLVNVVERKIDQREGYTPPVESMGPDETSDSGDEVTLETRTGDIERAVDEVLTVFSDSGVSSTRDSTDGASAESDADNSEAASIGTQSAEPAGRSETSETTEGPETSGSADRPETSERAGTSEASTHTGPRTPEEATKPTADNERNATVTTSGDGFTDRHPPQYTARTVTFEPSQTNSDDITVWDYWQRATDTSRPTLRSVSRYVGIQWLGRSIVFIALLVGAAMVGRFDAGLYVVTFVVMGVAGAISAFRLREAVPLGTSWSSDPGRWRWPQSLGRLLIAFALVQAVLAERSVWAAFPVAVGGSVTPGVWQPPASDPVITRIFVIATISALAMGTMLVAIGLSWRLWTDRLAGGILLRPTLPEAVLTGSAAIVVVTPVQLLEGRETAGILTLPVAERVQSMLPGTEFVHVGLIVALGLGLLPSAYRLWMATASRVEPRREADTAAEE